MGDLGQLIASKGFKKLPKVQQIAQSGHIDCTWALVVAQLARVGASNTRDRRFKSSHRQHILCTIKCIEKMKIKKKDAGNGYQKRTVIVVQSFTGSIRN